MSLPIAENARVTIWSVEDRETYSLVKMGSSRKDKRTNEYANTTWSFVRFVGAAHDKAKGLNEKDRIVLKGATVAQEPYMKDGEKVWPKYPQITVFNFEPYVYENNEDGGLDKPPVVEEDEDDSDDNMPF
jgi:hypothetical protein